MPSILSLMLQAESESLAQAVASLQKQLSSSQEEVAMRRAAAVAAAASVEQQEGQLAGLKGELRGQRQQVREGEGCTAHRNSL